MFYTFDLSGNVARRLNSSGSVTSTDCYDGFGARTSSPTSTTDVFGFGGQFGDYTDTATSLVLCTHRYYDPAAGRWLTRDPLGYAGGVNLYAYTKNNPVDNTDPSGLTDDNEDYGNEWWNQMNQYFSAGWSHVQNTLNGWNDALGLLGDWVLGLGPTHRVYGPTSTQTQQLEDSLAGKQIDAAICDGKTNWYVSTPGAASNTIQQPWKRDTGASRRVRMV